jgi:hypothetical protein
VSLDVGATVRVLEQMSDDLSGMVQDADGAAPFGDAGPPELVTLLGALAGMCRFANMLAAQVCDAVTAIASEALGGEGS